MDALDRFDCRYCGECHRVLSRVVYFKLTVSTQRDVALSALKDRALYRATAAVRTDHRVEIAVVKETENLPKPRGIDLARVEAREANLVFVFVLACWTLKQRLLRLLLLEGG